jgi:hypothetical protein
VLLRVCNRLPCEFSANPCPVVTLIDPRLSWWDICHSAGTPPHRNGRRLSTSLLARKPNQGSDDASALWRPDPLFSGWPIPTPRAARPAVRWTRVSRADGARRRARRQSRDAAGWPNVRGHCPASPKPRLPRLREPRIACWRSDPRRVASTRCCRSRGLDPTLVGQALLELADRPDGIEFALAYVSIIVKARMSRRDRDRRRPEG